MDLVKTLAETEPFSTLPEAICARLNQAASLKKFPPHMHIFKQQDPPSGFLYVIKSGLIEIVVQTPGGVEMIVDYRRDGSFFGGTPIFTDEGYTAGARTAQETTCFLIPQEILLEIAKDFPHLAEHFTKVIYSRIRNLYSEMVSEHSQNTLAQMEAYPFKKRLSEIMSTDLLTCSPDATAKEIAVAITRSGSGAALICDNKRTLLGIITEHDLVAKVIARDDTDCKQTLASSVMTAPPFTLTPDTFMYEAATFMMGKKIRHLPILDRGRLVGLVTLQDLMRYRSQKSMLLVGNISQASTIDELIRARQELVKVARVLLSESRSHTETMEIISYIHQRIIRRAYELVLAQQQQSGAQLPDIKHCFIIMGSGGRKEMLLGPDQDNGLIFEDYPEDRNEEVDSFFIPFADKLVETLATIGYSRCKGNVMVNNPLWRGRLPQWQERISSWIRVPEPQRVRYSSIFFDFMPIAGEASLCQDLRDIVHQLIKAHPIFLYHMMTLDFKHKVPLSLIGRFSPDRSGEHKGELSLKQAGSIFIVDCVRMFSLENQLEATTTIERLDKLVELGIFAHESAEHIKAAFEAFTFLRLRNEIVLSEAGSQPSHYLNPKLLSKNEQDLLKEAFRVASKLQDSTKHHFSKIVG